MLHLDALTAVMELESFVVCVPLAGFLAVPDHQEQAPAAALLGALVERRRAQGRAASLLALGRCTASAVGTEAVDADPYLGGGWQRPMPEELVGPVLERVLAESPGETLAFGDIHWGDVADHLAERSSTAVFDDIPAVRDRRAAVRGPGRHGQAPEWTVASEQVAALPEEERHRLLLDVVRSQLAAVLGYGGSDTVGPEAGLRDWDRSRSRRWNCGAG
ncbi:hypothetical protein IHE55_00305 [Streptomyces pactum]|uniref:Uncharacterized protein n=1 Tax=Streptomyces pactum TaxID=68249 RepID=A0ABS0NDS0_9ACTN|nr:beta-ketoacyl reductase [Streptomyces pactum]MBH5333325.1 hypothetical protein [Streptomyces pactum]